MIRPNATRPSVKSSSRWYSTCTGGAVRRAGRRRGCAGGSGGTGYLPGEPAERLAPVLVVAELVEAGAGRREQEGLARTGGRGSGMNRGVEGAGPLEGDAGAVEGGGDRVGRLADQVGALDRRGCDRAREAREVGALERSAEDEVHPARERGERLDRGVGVRGLGVVHILDAAGVRHRLEPGRQRREIAQRPVDAVGSGAGGSGGGSGDERVLEVVVAAQAGVLPVDRRRVRAGGDGPLSLGATLRVSGH